MCVCVCVRERERERERELNRLKANRLEFSMDLYLDGPWNSAPVLSVLHAISVPVCSAFLGYRAMSQKDNVPFALTATVNSTERLVIYRIMSQKQHVPFA